MSPVTLKQLKEALKEELKPINQKLDAHSKQIEVLSTNMDSLILDMVDVQKKTDVLPDIHSLTKETREDVKDHEQRIFMLENTA